MQWVLVFGPFAWSPMLGGPHVCVDIAKFVLQHFIEENFQTKKDKILSFSYEYKVSSSIRRLLTYDVLILKGCIKDTFYKTCSI